MKMFFAGILLALGVTSVAQAGTWQGEHAYLRCNPDVAAAVQRGEFRSGWEHYQRHGQFENRVMDGRCHGGGGGGGWPPPPPHDDGGWFPPPHDGGGHGGWPDDGGWNPPVGPGRRPPHWFNEREYLRCHRDVRRAVRRGEFRSGWHHYELYGYYENRPLTCY